MSLQELFLAEKALAAFPGWSDGDSETRVSWFNAPIEIGGIIEARFTLHGECRLDLPDQNLGLELQLQWPDRRQRFSLARLDWRSIKGGHTNPRRRHRPGSGRRCPPTHYHDFELNFDPRCERMLKGDLPYARDLEPEPGSFEEARRQAGLLFKINNIDLVQRPRWQYDLFRHE